VRSKEIQHNIPVPKPPTNMTLIDSESSDADVGQANNNMVCDPTFAGAFSSNEPYLLTQGDLASSLEIHVVQAVYLLVKVKSRVQPLTHQSLSGMIEKRHYSCSTGSLFVGKGQVYGTAFDTPVLERDDRQETLFM